ncbi:MAG: FliM/FliN family flagellar motor switch protein [Buchnera aphidicola (Pentalonia nigronervosa)]|uniref:Flagellar motor switch protein FliN n=1 Tax=Buchnera aphidicola (Pentalonia nigronervosa) TaxID=1309793 RepID=A0A7H1AZB9_9GAMM|nr:MAG: FliM/FliN family flagellar motor switch protein [Buchnera aphidicola (Pentalonia nigronervosa)]
MDNTENIYVQQKKDKNKKKIHKEINVNKNDTNSKKIKRDDNKNTSNILQDQKKIVLNTSAIVRVELGKTKIKIRDFLNLSIGSMLTLDKLKHEPLNIFINNRLIGLGEIVFLENEYGIRITKIMRSESQ